MPSAYLSAIGVMGRRHLKGLVRAGFDVVAADPDHRAYDVARQELRAADLPSDRLRAADGSTEHFDVAVFCETAPFRLANFRRFLSTASAGRILLEKPLSANPADVDTFLAMADEYGVGERTQVNFIRRAWPHIQTLAALCANEQRFTMTLNAGAVGLANTGIHFLDTFLFLSGEEFPQVVWSALSQEPVASGRGECFKDFGADFVLRGSRGCLLASLEASSSADLAITIRGAHFVAELDYTTVKRWKLVRRKPDSMLPNYRCGDDYEVIEDSLVPVPSMDVLTESWACGTLQLSPLKQAAAAHRLLTDILVAGGAHPPYRFS